MKLAHRCTLLSAAVTFLVGASPTMAGEGWYIGANIGQSTLSHSIERNTGEASNPSITSLAEESDVAMGLSLGYKIKTSEDTFVAIEGFYSKESAETRNINNMLQTELELNSSYGVNLKAGVEVTPKFSVYALVGATSLDFDIHNSYPFAPPMRSGDADEVGFAIGFGAEYSINKNWSANVEYSRVNDVDFTPLPEVAVPGKINPNEIDFDSFKFGVNYSF